MLKIFRMTGIIKNNGHPCLSDNPCGKSFWYLAIIALYDTGFMLCENAVFRIKEFPSYFSVFLFLLFFWVLLLLFLMNRC